MAILISIILIFIFIVCAWAITAITKESNSEEKAHWKSIMRNPENYTGKTLQVSGKIAQVIGKDEEGMIHIKVDVDEPYYVIIPKGKKIYGGNPLEGDHINFIGTCAGTTTITTVLGAEVELPLFLYINNI